MCYQYILFCKLWYFCFQFLFLTTLKRLYILLHFFPEISHSSTGISLDILRLKLHMLCAAHLHLSVHWQWFLTVVFYIISVFELFFFKCFSFSWLTKDPCFLFFNGIIPTFSLLIYVFVCSFRSYQKFFIPSLSLHWSYLCFLLSNIYSVKPE